MIGNTYILKPAIRNPWELISFDGVPVGNNVTLKVVEVEKANFGNKVLGAKSVEICGIKYTIDPNHPTSWAYFTECMTNHDEYGIHKVEGLELDDKSETDYLMQGKNGGILMESVERIRGKIGSSCTIVKPLEDRYNEWILENIHVYELFCKFTLQAIESGKKKISHWLIVNRLRWEVEIETNSTCEEDKDYKISNDYIAFLARDFIKDHPEHSDIFNIKQMKRV